MTRRDNPRDSIIPDILRRLRTLETASPLGSSSITRGALRVASNEGLKVEGSAKVSGWLIVTGTARVTGRLEGSGTFDWTGPMNLQGAQTITGPTTFTGEMIVNGPWKLVGNGEITGNVDLKGILNLLRDLLVKAGGKIVIEGADQIVLEQSGGVARMRMGASEIRGGDGIGLYPNSGPAIVSTNLGLRIAPLGTIDSGTAGLPPGALYISPTGFLRRVI